MERRATGNELGGVPIDKNRGALIALVGVLLVFVGLAPAYWSISNGYPDGLDSLLEQQGVHEKESAYSPPLAELQNYGATAPFYVLSGVGGALIVYGTVLLAGKVVRRSRREDGP